MPYTYEDTVQGEARNAATVPSARSEVLTETFAQAFEENPIMAVKRFSDLAEDQVTGPRLSAETARAKLQDAGLDRDLKVSDGGITEAALSTLMERKRIEKRRQEVFARAEGGFAEGAERLGLAALTSLSDPVSAGLNFLPVLGEVRYARYLSNARSLAGRLGVRAAVGAAEGAAGAAIAEVPVYAMHSQEQADYDTADSLLNVAFGGVIGSGMHTVVGSSVELIQRTLGIAPEFERYRGLSQDDAVLVSQFLKEAPTMDSRDIKRVLDTWTPDARRAVADMLPESFRVPRAEDLSVSDRAIEDRLAGKVTGDLDAVMKEYAGIDGAMGGKLLNTDLARELSPDYRADRTRSAAVHEPSSFLVKQMYERRLAEAPKEGEDPLVVFSAGGTGSGKSTGLNAAMEVDPRVKRAQIIYDTNLNRLESAVSKIDQALEAGKRVQIVYTWRDPVDALTNGALPRAMRMGRTVPLTEHASTHVGAAKTIKELAAKYAGDDRVEIMVVDNSHGKGQPRLGQMATVPNLEYNRVHGKLTSALEEARATGAISEAVYRGTAGKAAVERPGTGTGDRGRAAPENGVELSASERVAAAPSQVQQAALRTAVGQAVEGRPINVDPILSGLPADVRRLLVEPDDAEYRAASAAAEGALARDVEPTTDASLKSAEDEADLAVADATETAKRLGVDVNMDPDFAAVMEGVEKAARWARVAELATVCLVRGG